MEQFNFSVLFLVLRLMALHVNIAFQVHRVDMYNLFNHPVQQVDPPQTNLCVSLIRFVAVQLVHLVLVCFMNQQF